MLADDKPDTSDYFLNDDPVWGSNLVHVTGSFPCLDDADRAADEECQFPRVDLDKHFAALAVSKTPPASTRRNVLVLRRDTGKTLGGAYPELDSGDAPWDIVGTVGTLTNTAGAVQLMPILCGNVTDPHGRITTTGAYWDALENVGSTYKPLLPQRCNEAAFLDWAYRQGYFDMVIGFRNGALDIFTFLGIPTVSIGNDSLCVDMARTTYESLGG
ncbi:hypothetical protein KCU83_g3354, partial [Aureobasidium melanogenum]